MDISVICYKIVLATIKNPLFLNVLRKTFLAFFQILQIIYRRISPGRLIFPKIFLTFSTIFIADIQTIHFAIHFISLNVWCMN